MASLKAHNQGETLPVLSWRATAAVAALFVLLGLAGCLHSQSSSGAPVRPIAALPHASAAPLPPDATLIENFIHIGFRWNDRSDRPEFALKFEKRELTYETHTAAGPDQAQEQALLDLLARISTVSGLTIRESDDVPDRAAARQPDLLLFFGGRNEHRIAGTYALDKPIAGSADEPFGTCFVRPVVDFENGVIEQAIVFIDTSGSERLFRRCLDEELLQALGLFRDLPPGIDYSVFVDLDGARQATLHDYVMLRLLYDDRIRPRMPAAAARATAETILEQVKADVLSLWPE